MQLGAFRDAVMVSVLPQTQACKDRVGLINRAVSVSAVCGVIVFGQSKESVRRYAKRRFGLWCVVAEEFATVIDLPIVAVIKDQPRIIRIRCGPGESLFDTVAVNVEIHSILRAC